ncbi:hypothetical protein GWK47_036815 [Chionoecetes opilio]|uniref:Uncharacterized protein n=1 Tax=Chionoecetes opilio TaxID=41210 RepID=A0A8J4YM83_CHIOP|nr:hypothetical protein GWK47_036815 [Chionoecetes opilio]
MVLSRQGETPQVLSGCRCKGSHRPHRHPVRDLEPIQVEVMSPREQGRGFCSLDFTPFRVTGTGEVYIAVVCFPRGWRTKTKVTRSESTTEVMASFSFFERSFLISSARSLSFFLSWASTVTQSKPAMGRGSLGPPAGCEERLYSPPRFHPDPGHHCSPRPKRSSRSPLNIFLFIRAVSDAPFRCFWRGSYLATRLRSFSLAVLESGGGIPALPQIKRTASIPSFGGHGFGLLLDSVMEVKIAEHLPLEGTLARVISHSGCPISPHARSLVEVHAPGGRKKE